jgi:hypothetical protein
MKQIIRQFKGIDYGFRPVDYFGSYTDLKQILLKNIKGSFRRKQILQAIEDDCYEDLPEMIRAAGLSEKVIRAITAMNPVFMGGEYLPDCRVNEVEVARIELESTTHDVISLRARLSGNRIHYGFVDEYGETIYSQPRKSSSIPLSLLELIALISGTYAEDAENYMPWAYTRGNIDCTDAKDDLRIYRDFTVVSSDFYPDLELHYAEELRIEFSKWIAAWKEVNHG